MDPRHRDGLLAIVGLVGLVALGSRTAGVDPFVQPLPAATGVLGALGLEAVFLRYPGLTARLWERPGVPLASLVLVVSVGVTVVVAGATWVLGTLAWGLVTYLVLLGIVLAGFDNPLAAVVRRQTGG